MMAICIFNYMHRLNFEKGIGHILFLLVLDLCICSLIYENINSDGLSNLSKVTLVVKGRPGLELRSPNPNSSALSLTSQCVFNSYFS